MKLVLTLATVSSLVQRLCNDCESDSMGRPSGRPIHRNVSRTADLRHSRELSSFNCCQFELEEVVFDIDSDCRPSLEPRIENSLRERILDQVLDDPAQGARPIGMVVTALAQQIHRDLGNLELDLLLGKLLAHPGKLEFDNLSNLILRQRVEHDYSVDAIEKLRPERLLELRRDLLPHPVILASLGLFFV